MHAIEAIFQRQSIPKVFFPPQPGRGGGDQFTDAHTPVSFAAVLIAIPSLLLKKPAGQDC
ncbi:hypothetical protein IP79_06380 [Porphyrobacter sp. AAP60]|nr:hypothetical protein IP79_06380 [Porphyrobacter sp. AAP60]